MNINNEIERGIAHNIIEMIDYSANAIVYKPIIRKPTVSITAISMPLGEKLFERITRFDTYVQIIDGTSELTINGKTTELKKGSSVIIPANSSHVIKSTQNLTMIITVIKSGYEE
jgi:quercetin dioxygenase-like cupin family protein